MSWRTIGSSSFWRVATLPEGLRERTRMPCPRSRFNQLLYGALDPVVNHQRVAGREQVLRHGFAHDAETNESDCSLHYAILLLV